jgi:hypothetical protein
MVVIENKMEVVSFFSSPRLCCLKSSIFECDQYLYNYSVMYIILRDVISPERED